MPSAGDRRGDVVEAALTVAREQGLDAMTMRAVATQLGSGVMSLYRHVDGKEALLDALVGRLLSEVALPDRATPWPDRLHGLADQLYDLALRYPTVVPLLLTRAYAAHEAVEVVAATAAIVADAGVPASQVTRLERMVSVFLLGYGTSAANRAFWSDPAGTAPRDPPADPADPAVPVAAHWRTELHADVDDLVTALRAAATAPS